MSSKEFPNGFHAHSIYLTRMDSTDLPDRISANIHSLRTFYPEFSHKLYTDKILRDFIAGNFDGEVLWAYDQLIPLAYKADLGRYCLLYKLGGIYSDLSINFVRRVWLDQYGDIKIFIFRDGFSHAPWIVSNSIIIARPGLLFFKILIDKIIDNAKRNYYGFNPLCPTGPNLFGRTAAQVLEMQDFVCGEAIRINKNTEDWSYSYLLPDGRILATNIKNGNGLHSLGGLVSDNYNHYWESRTVYKNPKFYDSKDGRRGASSGAGHNNFPVLIPDREGLGSIQHETDRMSEKDNEENGNKLKFFYCKSKLPPINPSSRSVIGRLKAIFSIIIAKCFGKK